MSKIEWKVNVSKEVALAARKSTYGETVFLPSDEQLAELSKGEVDFVSDYYVGRDGLSIRALPVDWVSVREAIREGAAAMVEKRDRDAALADERATKRRADIEAYLASSVSRPENWRKGLNCKKDRARNVCRAVMPDRPESAHSDPVVLAHRERLLEEHARITAEMQADAASEFLSRSFDDMLDHTRGEGWIVKDECQLYLDLTEATTAHYWAASKEADRKNAEDAKAQEEDERALVESFNEYAKARGWYTRALDEGYDVHEQVFDDLVAMCARGLPSIVASYREDSPEWEMVNIEDRDSPSDFAFGIRDQVVEAVERFEVPTLVRKDVSRIFRFRQKNTWGWVTAVLVWFSVDSEKVSSRVVVVEAEPMPTAITG